MSSDSLNTPLRQIEALLRKYQRDVWADRALEVQTILQQHGVTAACLATSHWWGSGAGSMNDVYFVGTGIPGVEQDQDNRTFRSALLAVCEVISANGISIPNAEACAANFRECEKNGIYDR
jgi:hypothetical protein